MIFAPGWMWLSIVGTENAAAASAHLLRDLGDDVAALVLLAAVGVRAVDHQRGAQAGRSAHRRRTRRSLIVVRRGAAARMMWQSGLPRVRIIAICRSCAAGK
jgi:hypothetical protein